MSLIFPVRVRQIIRNNKKRRLLTSGESGGAFDPDALAIITAIEATDAGTVNPDDQLAINNFVVTGKSQGWWNKMIAIYGLLGGTANSHRINWRTPGIYNVTWYGAVTHQSNGIISTGGYGYTSLVPSVVLTGSTAHLSIFKETQVNDNECYAGCQQGTSGQGFWIGKYVDLKQAWVNSANVARLDYTGGSHVEMLLANRSDSLATALYRNNVAVDTLDAVVSRPAYPFSLLARRYGANVTDYSLTCKSVISFVSVGLGLTPTEITNFYNAVTALRSIIRF